jgi:RNA polymerase sigma-B factor
VSHILRQSLLKLRKVLTSEEQKDRVLRRQSATVPFEVLDEETGAYTEEYFRNRLEEEVHRASSDGSSVALVLVEFVGLEEMARFYGPQSVTDFLADAADFLRDSFRRLDVVARYGVTGFAVILPSTRTGVAIVRQRLIQTTSNWTKSRLVPSTGITARVGTACSPDDGKTTGELIASAQPIQLERLAA